MQHYTSVDPSNEWKRGIVGQLVRVSGIVATIGADGLLSAASFVWLHWTVGAIVVAAGIFLVIWLITVRYYRIQRAESDQSLHFFFHENRDHLAKLVTANSDEEYRHFLDEFHRQTVQRLALFFRDRVGDRTINCAIRLAERKDGHDQYATVARSDGMDPCRNIHTQPIPHDKGLALALMNHELQGVFIVRDIPLAAKGPFWYGTKNDHLTDVKTVMAAPINGWENGKKVMLGILFISSKNDVFHEGHTLPLKAFADYLGYVYPAIMRRQGGTK